MVVEEIIAAIKKGFSDPEDIFRLYEESEKLSEDELKKLRCSGYGESLEMLHSGALEMKKNGTWEKYVKERRGRKKRTAEEIKKDILMIN